MEIGFLYAWPLWLVFVLSLVVILGAAELGRRLVLLIGGHGGDEVFTLEAAILGLLALMISFTFAMALSRHEARRQAVVEEANAISTTALRARLLPAPHAAEILALLRAYTRLRTDPIGRMPHKDELDTLLAQSNTIQEKLWQHAKAMAARDPSQVPTGLFIHSLNEMIDDQEKRISAIRNQIPGGVFLGLYGLAALAAGFAGYATGLDGKRTHAPVHVTGMIIAAVILLILDLDRPATGFVTVSQQPLLDTAAELESMTE